MDIKLFHNNSAWQNSHAQRAALSDQATLNSLAWHNVFMSSQQRGEMH